MPYREIIAVCSQIHTKHINTLCGQNVELLNVKLAVHIVTTGLHGVFSLKWQSQLGPCVTFVPETSQDVDPVWCDLRPLSSFLFLSTSITCLTDKLSVWSGGQFTLSAVDQRKLC